MDIAIQSEKAMRQFGLALGRLLKAGDVIGLTGDLGAGKTTLSKAIAEGMGIHESITSPTFTIVNEYEPESGIGLFHFDVYRISDSSELDEIGFDEYLHYRAEGRPGHHPGYASLIEWANLIPDLMPDHSLWLEIRLSETDVEGRSIIASSALGEQVLSEIWQQRLQNELKTLV